MGEIFRRKVRVCTACDLRLDTTAARRRCEAARHSIDLREQRIWWIKYRVGGTLHCETSGSADHTVAEALLRTRVGEGIPSIAGTPASAAPAEPTPAGGTVSATFADAAHDLLNDYAMNRRRSLRTLKIRVEKHLRPAFGQDALSAITTPRVRVYNTHRQAQGASNATINRDLITLKRLCTLAVQSGKLAAKPYIPLLKERNVRRGFFEPEQFQRVKAALPRHMQGIAAFACVTGWRTPSEVLPLEWVQVDMQADEVRLEPGATKNEEGRVFPFTMELRKILEGQQQIADELRARGIHARFVFCHTVGQKAGQRISLSAYAHRWWKARVAAGCPTRIPHDFRRTAVRNLVRAGVPERVAMLLTGHKTRAVFERYNIVSSGDLREAARRLDQFTGMVS
jgi:integrase